MNHSIVLVKPECLTKTAAVCRWLETKDFQCGTLRTKTGWRSMLGTLYPEFSDDIIGAYRTLYDKHRLPDDYCLIEVRHGTDSLQQLSYIKGHFRNYQTQVEDTLRGNFGWPTEYNAVVANTTLVLNGFHAPADDAELKVLQAILEKDE